MLLLQDCHLKGLKISLQLEITAGRRARTPLAVGLYLRDRVKCCPMSNGTIQQKPKEWDGSQIAQGLQGRT